MEETFPPIGRWNAAFSIGRQLNRLAFRHDHFAAAPSRPAGHEVANEVRAVATSLMVLRPESIHDLALRRLANQVDEQINQEFFAERYNAAMEIPRDTSQLMSEDALLDECRSNAGDLVSEVWRALNVESNWQPTISLGFVFDRFIRPRLQGRDLLTFGPPAQFEQWIVAGSVPRPFGNSDFVGDSESRWQPRSVREFEKLPHDTWAAEFRVACQLAGIEGRPLTPPNSLEEIRARRTYFSDLRGWLTAQAGGPVEERPPPTEGWSTWDDQVCFRGWYVVLPRQQVQIVDLVLRTDATRGSLRTELFGPHDPTERAALSSRLSSVLSQTNSNLKNAFNLPENPIVPSSNARGDNVVYRLLDHFETVN